MDVTPDLHLVGTDLEGMKDLFVEVEGVFKAKKGYLSAINKKTLGMQ